MQEFAIDVNASITIVFLEKTFDDTINILTNIFRNFNQFIEYFEIPIRLDLIRTTFSAAKGVRYW